MKNKTIIFAGMFVCCAVRAADYIDMQIRELQQRRDELKKQIAECEQNTRGYKIAGIATLGATGVGVVGNIALHNEIKKIEQSKNGGGYSGGRGIVNVDTQTQEQRDKSSCREFEKLGIELPEECKK